MNPAMVDATHLGGSNVSTKNSYSKIMSAISTMKALRVRVLKMISIAMILILTVYEKRKLTQSIQL